MISSLAVAWINAAIAAISAALVFRAINRMNGVTDHAMRFSFAVIGAGLAGEACVIALPEMASWNRTLAALNDLMGGWQDSIDTLLFGGLLAAFIGTRRVPAMIPRLSDAWRVRLSVATSSITFVLFLAGIAA